ncbi:hypothetical protein CEXT_298661 [Caerostris extrusa]|uniref:Uncharacterized protein n=1 Tax=Caerostris extrusa TaxID=172846 RepID=A0AAV4TA36_CAEEX|nr:hypothetical protein CEXT_298661 [Caerostris extrusa]
MPPKPGYFSSNFYRESRLHGNGVCGWDIRFGTTLGACLPGIFLVKFLPRVPSPWQRSLRMGYPPHNDALGACLPRDISRHFYREYHLHGNGVSGWDIRLRTTRY